MFRHDLSATAADVLHGVSAHLWYDACISVLVVVMPVPYMTTGSYPDIENWFCAACPQFLHYIIPQVWGACAPCFSPWCTRTLFLFPSQGHFWLFVEFCGWLLPALLVLVFGLGSIAGYYDPSVPKTHRYFWVLHTSRKFKFYAQGIFSPLCLNWISMAVREDFM